MGYNLIGEKLDLDTLKTSSIGVSGWLVSVTDMLPELVSFGVAVATLIYLVIKIKKELK
tara:strand:- start:82 stop:258 length:177 start_codon:yes stop_codon:yes gene_type:complete